MVPFKVVAWLVGQVPFCEVRPGGGDTASSVEEGEAGGGVGVGCERQYHWISSAH